MSFTDNIFNKLTILAVPLSVAIAVCYLEGYWGTFNIDIFSFLTFSEIAVLSIEPIWKVGISTILGACIGIGINRYEDASKEKTDSKTKIIKFFLGFISFLMVLILAIVFFYGGPTKWKIIPLLLTIPLVGIVALTGVLHKDGKIHRTTFFILMFTILLFTQSYGLGKAKALHIEQGSMFTYIHNTELNKYTEKPEDVRYLGKAGSYFFVYLADKKQVLSINLDKIEALKFVNHTNSSSFKSPSDNAF